MKKESRNTGLKDVHAPQKAALEDKHCPFYGNNRLRGNIFVGKVIRAKAQKTATVSWERLYYIPKFERYEKRRSKVQAHNPPSIDAKEGDTVLIAECKPISKTKHFVIVKKK